jgi:hypothetical protein
MGPYEIAFFQTQKFSRTFVLRDSRVVGSYTFAVYGGLVINCQPICAKEIVLEPTSVVHCARAAANLSIGFVRPGMIFD